jgi:hypothetical protein
VILPHDEVDLGVLAPDDHIMVSQSGRYARKILLSGIPQSSGGSGFQVRLSRRSSGRENLNVWMVSQGPASVATCRWDIRMDLKDTLGVIGTVTGSLGLGVSPTIRCALIAGTPWLLVGRGGPDAYARDCICGHRCHAGQCAMEITGAK